MGRSSCALVALCIAIAAQQAVAFVRYAELVPLNNQWTITVQATKTSQKFPPVYVDQVCNATALSAPCNQPLLSNANADSLRFTFQQKAATLQTLQGLTPTRVLFKACYSKPFQAQRGWRTTNAVIEKDRSCPIVLGSFPYATTPFTFEYKISDNTTQSTWFAAVFVKCSNGTTTTNCQHDTTDALSSQPTYWATTQIASITTGMKIATAVCSIIAPAFLGAYFVWEFYVKKQT